MWAFGHHNVPSYIVDPNGYVAVPEQYAATTSTSESSFDNGEPGQFDFMSRLVRQGGALILYIHSDKILRLSLNIYSSKVS